jgi:hypothetical protein
VKSAVNLLNVQLLGTQDPMVRAYIFIIGRRKGKER